MVSLFFTYVLLGLSIALPVGAVTIEMTKQGLKNGFMHGWFVGLGGMTVDFLLIILLYFGFAPYLSLPIVQNTMWIMGSLFLVFIGMDSIKNAEKDINFSDQKIGKSLKSSFFNGFLVAISPGSLIFWLGIFGTVLADAFHTTGISGFSVVAIGILVGILIHDIILMFIIAKARVLLNSTIIKWISIIAGYVLFGFAIYFAYEFFVGVMKEFMNDSFL